MQRKDGEGEGEYRFRKAQAQNMMAVFEELLTQVDEITIGWDGNEALKKGVLEFNVIAKPDSDYAKALKDLAGRPSYFHIAQEDTGKPLTVSVSWRMNKREKNNAAELIEAARIKVTEELTAQNKDALGANQLCDVAAATVAAGHIDGFLQISVPEAGKFVVLGGVKLQGRMPPRRRWSTCSSRFLKKTRSSSRSRPISIRIRGWPSPDSARPETPPRMKGPSGSSGERQRFTAAPGRKRSGSRLAPKTPSIPSATPWTKCSPADPPRGAIRSLRPDSPAGRLAVTPAESEKPVRIDAP